MKMKKNKLWLVLAIILAIAFVMAGCDTGSSPNGPEKPASKPALDGTVSISGTAQVGQTLTADVSALGGTGDISYQWKSGDNYTGSNSSTYTVLGTDAGKAITVTVTRSGNSGSVTSSPTAAVIDTRPALTGTVSITGTPEVGQTLTADVSALEGTGDIFYQWKRGDTVTGTNSNTYTVLAADAGKTITVTVTRSGNSGSKTSSPTAAVTIPALIGTVSISGTAEVGEILTADTSELGGTGAISYQWKSGGTNTGTNSATYTVQSSDIDKTITVTVTRADSEGSKTSAPTTPVPDPNAEPLTGSVTISISEGGAIEIGKTLIAVTTYLDGTGTIYYQWKRGDVNVGTNSTYKVQLPDGGSMITVTVTRQGYSRSVSSEPTDAVPIPSLTGSVSISGTAEVGQTLTADTTSLGGTAGDISYQWKRGGTNVGENQNTYTVQLEDVGSTITVTVSREYYSGSVTSPATSTVPVPPLTGTVSISGSAVVGQTLTATTSSLGGTAGTISYQWKRGGTNVGTNQNTYTVVAADVGSTITVTVSREFYTGTVTSPATSTVTYPAALGPVATANNVTISATAKSSVDIGGTAANAMITITLSNASFNGVTAGANVASWFSPTVAGLSYTVSSLSGNTIELSVTGTPTAASTSAVSISIPAANLLDSNGNPGITSDLAVSGTIAYSIASTPHPAGMVAAIRGSAYYADLTSAVDAVPANGSATIIVIKNIELTTTIGIPSGKTITLVAETDGLTISPTASYNKNNCLFSTGGTLNLGDPANTSHTPKLIIDGKNIPENALVETGSSGSSCNMYKGTELRNAKSTYALGFGVYVHHGGAFKMYGGVISGCYLGVNLGSSGSFTMSGGIIYGTTGGTYGSANAQGSFRIEYTGVSVNVMGTSYTTTGARTQTYGTAP